MRATPTKTPGIFQGIDDQGKGNGKFYERPTINGKRTWRLLDKYGNEQAAIAIFMANRTAQNMEKAGLSKDPYAAPEPTVAHLAEVYIKEGCPMSDLSARGGDQLQYEINRIGRLLPFWGERRADQLESQGDCAAYFMRRKAKMRKGCEGRRSTDMELITLSNILDWAVRMRKIKVNLLAKRETFNVGKSVKHCRDFRPRNEKEVHAIGSVLFDDYKSVSLGWQFFLELMTGLRTNEVLRLRWDAKDETQAGFIEDGILHVCRSKEGVNPYVVIHPALQQLLEAMRQWRNLKFPASPWFVPSYRGQGNEPVDKTSLTHALERISKLLSLGHRTSHGLRAYYVTVRRSMGIPDVQIAAEIGDRSGAAIITSTYGGIPPNFFGKNKLGWMVENPAWSVLNLPGNVVSLPQAGTAEAGS